VGEKIFTGKKKRRRVDPKGRAFVRGAKKETAVFGKFPLKGFIADK